jgi:hypothetical protein
MPADTLTLPPALTGAQTEEARAAYTNVAIERSSLSEAEAMEIAAEFYASGEPERVAALPLMASLRYEQIVAAWRQAGLLKG